jgi:hypothetical protein
VRSPGVSEYGGAAKRAHDAAKAAIGAGGSAALQTPASPRERCGLSEVSQRGPESIDPLGQRPRRLRRLTHGAQADRVVQMMHALLLGQRLKSLSTGGKVIAKQPFSLQ